MTTVLLTLVLGVLLLACLIVGSVAVALRSHARRQLADARADARRWVERLGGELLVLDGLSAGLSMHPCPLTGLAEAAERFTAAGSELAAATTPRQCRLAAQTAVEGLHHVRNARTALGLDPGPAVLGAGVRGSLRRAGGQLGASRGTGGRLAALVEVVLADLRAGALPPKRVEPGEWVRYWRARWEAAGDGVPQRPPQP